MVEWKKLGEVCDVLNGFAFKSKEYVPTGIRVIRISDVQSGYISDKDLVFYPVEKLSEYKRYLLKRGDLVMSLTGNPGRVACIQEERCALNQRVACLRAKGTSNSYLYYLFNCKEFEAVAFANSTGGAQKNLSTTWLNNYLIPIPSLEEQNRIVGILDTFTDSIENLKQQIAQRRKQFEFYRDQLLDLEGKEGVEMKTIQDICIKICSGGTPSTTHKEYYEGNIPWLRTQEVDWREIYDTDIKITKEAVERSSAKIIPINCVIVAMYGATAAKSAINKIALTTNQACCNLEIDSGIALYKYVFHWMCKEYLNLKSMGEGSQNNINGKKIKTYPIPVPPLPEQSRIVSILDTFEASITNLEAQLAQRQKQYEYYRNKLLTFEGG